MFRRALCLFALLAAVQAGSALAKPAVVVGQPAPPFTLRILGGEEISLASMRGQVVVLNYWATWCVPCRKEMPLLEAYYQETARNGLRVFAITTEGSVPLRQMKKLTDAMTIPFVKQMRGDYGVLTGVPTNYIIDRSGVVRYAKAGALDLDDLNELLVPLLNEAPPPPL